MEGVDATKYERLARFLDGLDRADPNTLEEPFRSLWFRIKDIDPKTVKVVPVEPERTDAPSSEGNEFTIEESEPVVIETAPGREKRIEVITPSQAGPTFEMKVETKPKVTFKAAGEGEVETVRKKEGAAKSLLKVQEALVPLKGVGGDAQVLFSMNKDMAKHYREGDYDEVDKVAGAIISTMAGKEFRHSMMVYLQKKLKEYEDAGIEMGPAKERFKQVAISYKDETPDFSSLLGACNKMAEDAARAVMGDPEEAEVVVAEIVRRPPEAKGPKEEVAEEERTLQTPKDAGTEPASVPEKDSATVGTASPAPPKEAPSPPSAPPESDAQATQELKPVIKIVKKRLVPVENGEGTTGKAEDEPAVAGRSPPDVAEVKSGPTAPSSPDPKEREAPKEKPSATAEKDRVQEVKGTEDSDLQEAFRRISSVYNAAAKMHAAGKDVKQIFEMYNFAEDARKKGNNKIYIGLSKQLESMLLAMQSRK